MSLLGDKTKTLCGVTEYSAQRDTLFKAYCLVPLVRAPHWQVLLRMFLSVILHLTVPGGACSDALPSLFVKLTFIITLRSAVLCVIVNMHP